MGIKEDLKQWKQYREHRRRDTNLEQDIIRSNVQDSVFRRRYDSFLEALTKELKVKFLDENRSMVELRPNTVQMNALFDAAMKDERITDLYKITPVQDGSYKFEMEVVDFDLAEYFDDEDARDRQVRKRSYELSEDDEFEEILT